MTSWIFIQISEDREEDENGNQGAALCRHSGRRTGICDRAAGGMESFLATAARNYKYPYYDQLMIYLQRSEATACAEYDFWFDAMHSYVKR